VSLKYDEIAAHYDRRYLVNDYSGVEQALLAFVGPDLPGRVLEVGCGTGHWLTALTGRVGRVAGLDASYNMLAYARSKARPVFLAQGRAEHLPFVDAAFDRLFCINAFHHFDDKPGFLGEVRRVLQTGGAVMTIGLDPHVGVDRWYIYEYFEPVLEIDKRRYAPTGQIREWMRDARFSNVRTLEVQHLPALLAARTAIEEGRLDRGATSQLAVLSDEQYQQGIDRIHRALESAEAKGETLYLSADLRLYATYASVPA
jgi:ubiquinone/menaquinone biosynthesis C-methylase UbiE